MPLSREAAVAAGTFALVAALGFDEGGYAPTAWGWSAVILMAALSVIVGRGGAYVSRRALIVLGALGGLAAWTAASTLWSDHVAASVLEAQRLLLYVAAAATFVVVAASPGPILAGVLAASTVLCGYGLGRWLLGDPEVPLSADPQAAERLSEPLGYANGVAVLAAMGLLLAAGLAARAEQTRVAALAAAPVPLLAATLYFTFGRGAWLALAIGLAAAVASGPDRLQLAATAGALTVPAAASVAAATTLGAGRATAATVVLLTATAAATPFAVRAGAARITLSPRARAAVAIVLVALPVVAAVAALIRVGGPRGAYDAFAAAPAPVHGAVERRVLSLSGSSRGDYWRVAWREYREHAALGAGAGTYARTWLRERPYPQPARDAHSLYLETLAELGPIGLALLLVAVGTPLATARNRWTPAALGPYAAFLAHAGQDWDWELPAVTVAALACASALLVRPGQRRVPRSVAVAAAALGVVALAGFAGNRAVAEAVAAADRAAYDASAEAARNARRLQPWSAEPWRLLGEAQLADGDVEGARRSFSRGIGRDSADWELWLDLGLATDGPERRRAWQRAASLNPLSPELKELGFDRR